MEAFQAVIHNSQDVFYRSPFGAAPWNTKITVRLKVSRGLKINKIWLRLWEKDEQLIEMHFLCPKCGQRYLSGGVFCA